MTFRRPGAIGLLATAVMLTLTVGCSSSSSGTNGTTTARIGPLETTNLTVAAVPTTDSTGLYVAQAAGLFAKYGLHVKIVPAISAEQSVNQLATNEIQILSGNYVSMIEAQINHDHGVKPVNIPFPPGPTDAQISANLDIFAEASVEQPGFLGLFVNKGSKIRSAAQLKGKTIAINAPNNVAYLLFASWEEANGLQPPPVGSKLLQIVPFPFMGPQLQQGKFDVAFLAEPFVSIMEAQAGFSEITNIDEGAVTGFPIQGYAATKQWARANPNTLAAFYSALEQGQELASTDRGLAEKATVQNAVLGSIIPLTQKTPPTASELKSATQIGTLLQFETYPTGQVDVTRLQRVLNVIKQFQVFQVPANFKISQLLGDGN